MKLVVGVLTYNQFSAPYLESFWTSLKQSLEFLSADHKILVGDNSEKSDNPNALFFNSKAEDLEFIHFGGNLGFSRGYNRLIDRAKELEAQYFLVINPDTVIDRQAISVLLDVLDKEPGLSSLSPRVMDLKGERIDTLGLGLKPGLRFFDVGQGQLSGPLNPNIIGPSGAAAMFRLSALLSAKDEYGYFDERMFMYKEDCDLAYRLWQSGHLCRLVNDALVYHDRSAKSSGQSIFSKIASRRSKSHMVRRWSFVNQQLIWRKHWRHERLPSQVLVFFLYLASLIWAFLFERFLLNNREKSRE